MEYNIIFPRIFNDIPFNTILYSILRLNRNIISYFFLRSAYSPRRFGSLRGAPLTVSRCLGGESTPRPFGRLARGLTPESHDRELGHRC